MRYDVLDLRLLVAVADAQSITAGALTCQLSPSSASVRLRSLEEVAGSPLFERHARGVRMTPSGEIMVQHVRNCLEILDRMQADLSRYAEGLKSQLRILVDCSSVASYLLEDLQRHLSVNPLLRIRLEDRSTEETLDAVLSRRVDLAVVAHLESDHPELALTPFARDRLVVASPDALLPRGTGGITFRSCLDLPIVTLGPTATLSRQLARRAAALGRQLDICANAPSFAEMLRLVSAGVGIAILPHPIAMRANLEGTHLKRLIEPWALRVLHVCTLRDPNGTNRLAKQFSSTLVPPPDLTSLEVQDVELS